MPSPRLSFIAVVVAASALVGACTAGDVVQAPSDDPELMLGQDIYSSNCSSCHGAAGDGGRGTKLNGGSLLEKYPDVADQRLVIEEGRRTMPAFGKRISAEELDAVVRYTREVLN